jgi:hypothetical protein
MSPIRPGALDARARPGDAAAMKRLSSIITVVSAGAALTIGGCHKSTESAVDGAMTTNPPIPEAAASAEVAVAPDAAPTATDAAAAEPAPDGAGGGDAAAAATGTSALPTWDQVESGHPQGATNPPRPVLVVNSDASRCWKEWVGGMRPDPNFRRIAASGGRVLADGEAPNGTEIVCPTGASAVVDAWARSQEL